MLRHYEKVAPEKIHKKRPVIKLITGLFYALENRIVLRNLKLFLPTHSLNVFLTLSSEKGKIKGCPSDSLFNLNQLNLINLKPTRTAGLVFFLNIFTNTLPYLIRQRYTFFLVEKPIPPFLHSFLCSHKIKFITIYNSDT